MTIQDLKNGFGPYAKDTKLNLSSVLSEEGSPGLSENQIFGIALACAFTTKNQKVVEAIEADALDVLSAEEVEAAKAASTIMAMNNVYYRFAHSAKGDWLQKPAGLRMNVIGAPGIDHLDFELYALAVSAINGCGLCMDTHTQKVLKDGVREEGVQSTIRIAAVLSAAAQAVEIENMAS